MTTGDNPCPWTGIDTHLCTCPGTLEYGEQVTYDGNETKTTNDRVRGHMSRAQALASEMRYLD